MEKEPCEKCEKSGDVTLKTENWTIEELELAVSYLDKYKQPREEIDYVYNVYNRVFKTKKAPGCGKCFVNIGRSLKNKLNDVLK
jgi:hypothetical protein